MPYQHLLICQKPNDQFGIILFRQQNYKASSWPEPHPTPPFSTFRKNTDKRSPRPQRLCRLYATSLIIRLFTSSSSFCFPFIRKNEGIRKKDRKNSFRRQRCYSYCTTAMWTRCRTLPKITSRPNGSNVIFEGTSRPNGSNVIFEGTSRPNGSNVIFKCRESLLAMPSPGNIMEHKKCWYGINPNDRFGLISNRS